MTYLLGFDKIIAYRANQEYISNGKHVGSMMVSPMWFERDIQVKRRE